MITGSVRAEPPRPRAFFLPAPDGGQRFALWHTAYGGRPRALMLYVHPLAEEMNKARRMAALQSRLFAQAGCSVLQIDLRGCGDSSGAFADASWQDWIDDVVHASRWLRDQADAPLWLWGLRAGCLVCNAAAAIIDSECGFLFWQPMNSGRTVLQQFLRVRIASDAIGGAGRGTTAALREAVARGESIDVGGYRLGAALAAGLEGASLNPPGGRRRLIWLQVSSGSDVALSPDGAKQVDQWTAAGHRTTVRVVAGPAFWQSTEIETAPALLEATVQALDAGATA